MSGRELPTRFECKLAIVVRLMDEALALHKVKSLFNVVSYVLVVSKCTVQPNPFKMVPCLILCVTPSGV